MLFVHSLCAFLTALIAASRLTPFGVSPIHHLRAFFQKPAPTVACAELPHFTCAGIEDVVSYALSTALEIVPDGR